MLCHAPVRSRRKQCVFVCVCVCFCCFPVALKIHTDLGQCWWRFWVRLYDTSAQTSATCFLSLSDPCDDGHSTGFSGYTSNSLSLSLSLSQLFHDFLNPLHLPLYNLSLPTSHIHLCIPPSILTWSRQACVCVHVCVVQKSRWGAVSVCRFPWHGTFFSRTKNRY